MRSDCGDHSALDQVVGGVLRTCGIGKVRICGGRSSSTIDHQSKEVDNVIPTRASNGVRIGHGCSEEDEVVADGGLIYCGKVALRDKLIPPYNRRDGYYIRCRACNFGASYDRFVTATSILDNDAKNVVIAALGVSEVDAGNESTLPRVASVRLDCLRDNNFKDTDDDDDRDGDIIFAYVEASCTGYAIFNE
ncbi:hypothetical protein Vadar_002310 [Vaccinium darrowii]|uniref:Uncharacterized protein n=1 Tax=Vaccinium darrowii TaxID=229202 RepID=A0ACB7XMK7_9ERIC|nr:hypothetical protein Vadar_002310 [Vaccinium darrowii]